MAVAFIDFIGKLSDLVVIVAFNSCHKVELEIKAYSHEDLLVYQNHY